MNFWGPDAIERGELGFSVSLQMARKGPHGRQRAHDGAAAAVLRSLVRHEGPDVGRLESVQPLKRGRSFGRQEAQELPDVAAIGFHSQWRATPLRCEKARPANELGRHVGVKIGKGVWGLRLRVHGHNSRP